MSRRLIPAAALMLAALPAAAEVAITSYAADDEGPHPKALRIADADGGRRITVALEGLPDGARILAARLRAERGDVERPADLLKDPEVHVGARPGRKPLPLIAPTRDAFDVTDAVRAAVADGEDLELFVKRFPGWRPERTRLEVTFEGRAPHAPPPVTDLKAFHHAGQTFLTWKEPDPPIATPTCTWGEYRKALAGAAGGVAYRVYVHDKPIDARSIAEATCLGEVGAGSCWNVKDRNIEYLIARAMVRTDETGELARRHNGYMYTWGPDSERMDRYPLRRLVVPAGAAAAGEAVASPRNAGPAGRRLPAGTGLFVRSPARAGRRWYAVAACRAGAADLSGVAAVGPVVETVGDGEPVCQGPGMYGPYFDNPGRRWLYVQWGGPETAPRPNMHFNWTVFLPRDMPESGRAQVELHLYDPPWTHARPRHKLMRRSVQLCTQDDPFSGWYGYHEAFGTLAGYAGGRVRPHTHRRILAMLRWAAEALPIDPDRVMLYGSDGAALLALSCPGPFAYVLTTRFTGQVLDKDAPRRFARPWGPKHASITGPSGRGEWGWAMLDRVARDSRAEDLPAFFCRGYSWGRFVKGPYKGEGRFYTAMREAHHPIVANWVWASGQLLPPDKYTGTWRGQVWTRRTPVPAFANCTLDSGRMHAANTNARLDARVTRDTPHAVEVVIGAPGDVGFDMTVRRLQRFKVKPRQKLRWAAEVAPGEGFRGKKPDPQSGVVTVDEDGVWVITGLKNAGRCALTVTITPAK